MLSGLFEQLPEVGDMDKPKLVFFFDEAHYYFDNASQALQQKIEQVVRLIRSKGVGIYFITQNHSIYQKVFWVSLVTAYNMLYAHLLRKIKRQ